MPVVIPAIMAATAVAGKVAEGRAKGRAAETQLNTQRDALNQDTYRAQLDADAKQRAQALEERKFGINANRALQSQLVRGSLMQGLGGKGTGTLSAGLSDDTKAGGGALVQSALDSLMRGQQFDPMTQRTAPGLTPVPKAGKLDTFLNILGGVGSIGGAAMNAYRPNAPGVPQSVAGFIPQ